MKKPLKPPVWGNLWVIEKQSKPYGDLKMPYHLKADSIMKILGSTLFALFLGLAVAVTDDGTVFVADYGNNCIQKWQPKNYD